MNRYIITFTKGDFGDEFSEYTDGENIKDAISNIENIYNKKGYTIDIISILCYGFIMDNYIVLRDKIKISLFDRIFKGKRGDIVYG